METLTVNLGTPFTFYVWGSFSNTDDASVSLTKSDDTEVSFVALTNVYRSGAQITIPADYLIEENLPAVIEVTLGGQVVKSATLVGPTAPVSNLEPRLSAIEASLTPTVKRVTMSLGAPNSSSVTSGALADWAERYPISLPVRTVRWRLKVANRNVLNNTSFTTPFNVSDVYFGSHAPITSGRPTASYDSAPTKVFDGFSVPTDGTDYVTPWVTDSALQFNPGQLRMVGWNLSGPNSGSGFAWKGARYGLRNADVGAAATISAAEGTGYVSAQSLGDIRIEYEFEGEQPVGLFIGASNDEGYNINEDGAGSFLCMAHEAWPGAFGMRHRIPWVNGAISGASEASFSNPNAFAYTRFDLSTVPDFAVLNLGGNAILGLTPLETIQANISNVVETVRGLGINRIYLTTMQPVGSGRTNENAIRTPFNTWIRSNPLGVTGSIDLDIILRNPAALLGIRPEFNLADNIHINRAGHQWVANSVAALA